MKTLRAFQLGTAAILPLLLAGSPIPAISQQNPAPAAVRINDASIGGVVTSTKGPEAGVWVIAETKDLPTKFAKIVVTDDQGRYAIPDLPKGNYDVWVRGYGLVDSAKVQATPGKIVNLTAVVAPTQAAAAQYYPAIYWYSMLNIPDKGLFPGTGPSGNGIPVAMKTQADWMNLIRSNGCVTCHALGNAATRAIPASLGHFDNSYQAWERRIQSGQAGASMVNGIANFDTKRALTNFADWTDRIAAGELPATQPQRPTGVERNVVVTEWDWGSATTYLHDLISTDKRNPTVNAYGVLYGSPEVSTDNVPTLDPVKNVAAIIKAPYRDADTPSTDKTTPNLAPSPYFGTQAIWDAHDMIHNQMFDEVGRVWATHTIRAGANEPAFCKAGSDHPSAKMFPLANSGRQLSMYDPSIKKWSLIDTCFADHHLEFDANGILWTSGGGQVIGWLDSKKYLETGDAEHSQGWAPLIIDTVGDGKMHAWTEPGMPTDPTKDVRVTYGFYSVAPNPADGTIWGASQGNGYVTRFDPKTMLTEVYKLPPGSGGIRGGDIDSNGVFWAGLNDGQFASFDRRKCKGPLNGPGAELGLKCPEGWTEYPFPGPQFTSLGKDAGSAEASYYTWVDQHNTSGLGANVPIATGNENESLIALVDGKMVQLRVPYPMGFYAKNLDGRIDDASAGWKGRELWSTNGNRTPQHIEGGAGTLPKVYEFQVRPDPLAL